MPLWEPKGSQASPASVGTFEPIEIIHEFDGIRTFTCRASDGGLLLAHQCDELDGESRFIVVPTEEWLVEAVKNGRVGIRWAITQARTWLVDLGEDGNAIRAFKVSHVDIPNDNLPSPQATFGVAPEVALSIRAIGNHIGRFVTPASVVKAVANSAYTGLKRLVDYLSQMPQWANMGADFWRGFYDLPTHRIKYASFEVQFGWPAINLPDHRIVAGADVVEISKQVLGEMRRLLSAGAAWCGDAGKDQLPGKDSEESRAILEAIEQLSPPQTGPYMNEVQVGGQLVGGRRAVLLTRTTREHVRGRLKSEKPQRVYNLVAEGVVESVDRGLQRFILRQVTDLRFAERADKRLTDQLFKEIHFEYPDDWAEPILEAFDSGVRIRAGGRGRLRSSDLYALQGFIVAAPFEGNGDNGADRDNFTEDEA